MNEQLRLLRFPTLGLNFLVVVCVLELFSCTVPRFSTEILSLKMIVPTLNRSNVLNIIRIRRLTQ